MREAMLKSPGRLANRLYGRQFQLPADKRLIRLQIEDSILDLVPESVARDNCVLPVDFDGETIVFVTPNDTDIMLADKLRFILNRNVRFIARDRDEVLAAINHYYGEAGGPTADSMLQEFADTAIDFTEMAIEDEPDLAEMFMSRRSPLPIKPARLRRQLQSSFSSPTESESEREGLMFYTISCQMERAQRRRQEQMTEVEHDFGIETPTGGSRTEPERTSRSLLTRAAARRGRAGTSIG